MARRIFSSAPIAVDPERRTQLLRHLIQQHGWERTLVFVATKYATEHIAMKLERLGIAARAPAWRAEPGRTHLGTGGVQGGTRAGAHRN